MSNSPLVNAKAPPPFSWKPRQLLKWWFSPRSTDREKIFVEMTLRGLVPAILIITILLNIISATVLQLNVFQIILAIGLPVAAFIAMLQQRVYVSGLLIVAYFGATLVILSLSFGYWGGAVTPIAMLILLLASLTVPIRFMPWIALGIFAILAGTVFAQVQGGVIPPLNDKGEPFTSPTFMLFPAALTLGLVLAYVSYLRREFSRRVQEVNTLTSNVK